MLHKSNTSCKISYFFIKSLKTGGGYFWHF